MANHRARETGKQWYEQVITGSLLSVNIFVFSCQTSNCRLFFHTSSCFQCARRTTCACAVLRTLSYARPLSKITPSIILSLTCACSPQNYHPHQLAIIISDKTFKELGLTAPWPSRNHTQAMPMGDYS